MRNGGIYAIVISAKNHLRDSAWLRREAADPGSNNQLAAETKILWRKNLSHRGM
jgi:hypothetical protein